MAGYERLSSDSSRNLKEGDGNEGDGKEGNVKE
jgi:hypothetical protein